jgi:L-rhamnose-H+ transport protein
MTSNPALGVLLHSVGGLAAASFYIPYKGVRHWAWENFWILGGIFSWIIAPWVLALIFVPQTLDVLRHADHTALFWTFVFGLLWGIGGLTFGLTMRYLGIALGYAIALGLCAAFGTLIPPIFRGQIGAVAATTGGKVTLLGIALCLVGIAVSGRAGVLKERELTEEQKRASVAEFSFWKGLAVAVLCGIMSAAMAFALDAATPIKQLAEHSGINPVWRGLPVLIVVLAGGFLTNFVWCAILLVRNRTLREYVRPRADDGRRVPRGLNLLLCALGGTIWYFQFFFYTMGESQMGRFSFASWTLHMASIIIFSTLWGIALREWRGTSTRTHVVIGLGLLVLVASMVVVGYGSNLQAAAAAKP